VEFIDIPVDSESGQINLSELENILRGSQIAGVILQSPNCFGVVEAIKSIAAICKTYDVLLGVSYNPWLSGIFTPPGDLGADIVACEGQVLGLPLSGGGPSLGILASTKELRRFMPGRIIGRVADIYGNPAYAMVYEDREQHVAREKATSNLCS